MQPLSQEQSIKLKPTLLALGAAAALGAASSAPAIAYFGEGESGDTGTRVSVQPNGIGQALIMPYFNAQGGTVTAFNITNFSYGSYGSGKAVRVHVRGAANGDRLLSFTVFLAPGSVWTAEITRGANGLPRIKGSNNACTFIKDGGMYGGLDTSFVTTELAPYISDAAKAKHAGEGYIEIINMADITGAALDDLKNGNCAALNNNLMNTTEPVNKATAIAAGLASPSGTLMGNWYIINQTNWSAFSGAMTAIDVDGRSYIRFAPNYDDIGGSASGWAAQFAGCNWSPCVPTVNSKGLSADVLGVTDWSQVPDLSTPLIPAFGTPQKQVEAIAKQMERSETVNDYVSEPNGSVPMLTDWVMSHPLRRFAGAVDYGSAASAAQVKRDSSRAIPAYGLISLATPVAEMGPVACNGDPIGPSEPTNGGRFVFASRDGNYTDRSVKVEENCGAVFTLGFADASPMSAIVGRAVVEPPAAAGWLRWQTYDGESVDVPVTGFAVFSAKNEASRITYATTWPHRHPR